MSGSAAPDGICQPERRPRHTFTDSINWYMPVLTFITSLRHPETTQHYAASEDSLRRSLRALDAQTDARCAAIVVSNRPFSVPLDLRLPVTTVEVGFPPAPDWDGETDRRRAGIRIDKGAKLAVALSRVTSGHVMALDADDFVSRRLTAFVAERGDEPGWYVDHGFRFDAGTGLLRRQELFNQVCGTSLIFARSLLPAFSLPPGVGRDTVLATVGEDRVVNELGSHLHLHERYGLTPLPFRGAVYCVNNGHNVSSAPTLTYGWPLTGGTAAEFGIPKPPLLRSGLAAARAIVRSGARRGLRHLRRLYAGGASGRR